LGWGGLRGLVLAGYSGLGMVNMNVGWLTDGWVDGWTNGLTTPQQLRTELLDPRVRCISAHFERSTYPFYFFHFFLPGSRTGSPQLSFFFRALHFQPASHRTLLVSLNPFSGFAEVLQHALFVYFLIPLRVRIRRWPWMLVWLENRDCGIFIERD